jgi:hypothetical protein
MTRFSSVEPIRARALAIALAAALAVVFTACGSGEESLDDPDLPYSFKYPGEFSPGGQLRVSAREEGKFENQSVIAKGDGRDLIAVQTQRSDRPYRLAVLRKIERSTKDIKVNGKKDVSVGGLDGVEFQLELKADGTAAMSERTYLAKNGMLYRIDCQWQSDEQSVLDACAKVLATFQAK